MYRLQVRNSQESVLHQNYSMAETKHKGRSVTSGTFRGSVGGPLIYIATILQAKV